MDRKTKVATIVGITFMLLLIISSTYAYFMINAENNTTSTVITSHTEKVATASLKQNTSSLKLNLSANDMSLSNVGNYYADDENDYAPNKSLGYHELSTLTLTNSNEDNNIYKCNMNINVTFDTSENSIGSAILKDDLKIHFMIGNQNYEYDLSEYKTTGSLSKDIEIELIGNSDKILYGYVELKNKETEQNYLAGKNLNIEINTTLNKCELTGKEGVFMVNFSWSNRNEYFKSPEYIDKIKSISFVNYIDKDYENKIHWDMSKTEKNNSVDLRIFPVGTIIGWLEENGDEEIPYDLYIGTSKSNQVIFVESLNGAFHSMSKLENFNFSNLNTSITADMNSTFYSCGNLKSLDVTSFDTSKVTTMSEMFRFLKLEKLDLNNFNTSNVTSVIYMFHGCNNLKELIIDNFNTRNVIQLGFLFDGTKVKDLILNNFDTSNVISMWNTFYGLTNVKKIDLSTFNTSKVSDMQAIFYGFVYDKLDISKFKSDSLTNVSKMFQVAKINTIDMHNMDFTKVTQFEDMFDKFQGNEIIVKDDANKKWIEARLAEAGVSANVIVAS